jgi:inosine-uridine nucleoside N-ribohydrolase
MAADPEAAKIVLETWGPKLRKLVMIPIEVSQHVPITQKTKDSMKAIGNPLSLTMCELWDRATSRSIFDPFNLHFACGVLYLWRPDLFQGR